MAEKQMDTLAMRLIMQARAVEASLKDDVEQMLDQMREASRLMGWRESREMRTAEAALEAEDYLRTFGAVAFQVQKIAAAAEAASLSPQDMEEVLARGREAQHQDALRALDVPTSDAVTVPPDAVAENPPQRPASPLVADAPVLEWFLREQVRPQLAFIYHRLDQLKQKGHGHDTATGEVIHAMMGLHKMLQDWVDADHAEDLPGYSERAKPWT